MQKEGNEKKLTEYKKYPTEDPREKKNAKVKNTSQSWDSSAWWAEWWIKPYLFQKTNFRDILLLDFDENSKKRQLRSGVCRISTQYLTSKL